MRLRTRLLGIFLVLYGVLAVAAGTVGWHWLDERLRREAEQRAAAVAAVLAGGGFTPNDAVLTRMRALVGAEVRFVSPESPVAPGTVRAADGGRVVEVTYRTPAYEAARSDLLVTVSALTGLGLLVVAAATVVVAATVARPLEQLARAARRIGSGDLLTPVAGTGRGEVAALATDLEGMRTRLADLERRTRDAERLAVLGTFSATVAHEVRNPLSAVRLTIQMLARRLPDESQLGVLAQELERLDLIVDELLAYARGMTVRCAPVDLASEAAAALALLRRQADHAGVELRLVGAGQAMADPRRLRQLLLNLVLNGIQAVQAGGGGAVTVTVRDGALEVADDGPGLAPELLERLAQPFATGRAEGTGLGLHLAQTIVAAHGGSFSHHPVAPHGARFVCRLTPDGR
jgi:signal transduction histidine kinase